MKDLEQDLLRLKNFYLKESTKKDILEIEKEKLTDELARVKDEVETLEKVIIIFQKSSQYARQQGKINIENLTSKSLQYIFKSDYKFEVDLFESRNVAGADFYVVEKNEDIEIRTKPEISNGGGIVDVISLALRLAFIENASPRIEGPLILDEPAKHVSEEYTYDIGDFLMEFSKSSGRQIIMITHNPHLAALADNIYRVIQEDGVSKVEKQDN